MPRFVLPLALFVLAAPTHAARVAVVLPQNVAMRVYDRNPPAGGPRIDCPGICTYDAPGNRYDLVELKVEVVEDPRTLDPPWDIVEMKGCRGTSALPATNGLCFLDGRGNDTVSFDMQYRPVLAVTFGGTMAGEVSGVYVTGTVAPGSGGTGTSFSCNIAAPTPQTCARHFSLDKDVLINAPSTDYALVLSASEPCGGPGCTFTLAADTCISFLYKHNRPPGFPEKTLEGPECPTGPGIGGGGGGGDPPPELVTFKELALEQMKKDFEQGLYPCLTGTTGLALFFSAGVTIGPIVGGAMAAAAGPQCVSLVRRIVDLQKIYEDPPDFDFHRVAKVARSARGAVELPSCKGLARADKRVCTRLASAVRGYVKKVEKATAVVESLRITFERAAGAHIAGEARAFDKQVRAAGKRAKQLDAALEQKARAGAKLAAVLAEAEATALLDAEGYAEAAAALLAELVAAGLPEEDAAEALGDALTPKAVDLVALLAQP
jgi:hypothetical protein